MVAILAVVTALGVGVWRGIMAYRKRNPYGTSPTFIGLLWTVIGLGVAVGCYLATLFLPLNVQHTQIYPLDNIKHLVSGDAPYYFVAENYGEGGNQIRSFIVDIDGQTVLRSDVVVPSRIFVGSANITPTARYVISEAYYPWIFPFAIRKGGFQGQTVELRIPPQTIFQDFHLPSGK